MFLISVENPRDTEEVIFLESLLTHLLRVERVALEPMMNPEIPPLEDKAKSKQNDLMISFCDDEFHVFSLEVSLRENFPSHPSCLQFLNISERVACFPGVYLSEVFRSDVEYSYYEILTSHDSVIGTLAVQGIVPKCPSHRGRSSLLPLHSKVCIEVIILPSSQSFQSLSRSDVLILPTSCCWEVKGVPHFSKICCRIEGHTMNIQESRIRSERDETLSFSLSLGDFEIPLEDFLLLSRGSVLRLAKPEVFQASLSLGTNRIAYGDVCLEKDSLTFTVTELVRSSSER